MERLKGVIRSLPGGWVGTYSTPMAQQYRHGLDLPAEMDENTQAWYEHRTSDLAILTPGAEEWRQWLCVDTSILR
eukprot:7130027-Pyramimonas_sp.AAC.1